MATWARPILLALLCAACGAASNDIEYRGEKIKLSKYYADYDEYKNDPDNIDPAETERVQRLVMSAPIDRVFASRLEASRAVGQIAFPGYGSSGFHSTPQADGSVLMGFSVEIPRAGKDRYFIFSERAGGLTLIDDFVQADTTGLLHSVVRRNHELVFSSLDGKEALVRPYRE